jgi:hypothetical protein
MLSINSAVMPTSMRKPSSKVNEGETVVGAAARTVHEASKAPVHWANQYGRSRLDGRSPERQKANETAGLMWAPLQGPNNRMANVTTAPKVKETARWLAPSATLPQPTPTIRAVPRNSPATAFCIGFWRKKRLIAFPLANGHPAWWEWSRSGGLWKRYGG